MVFFAKNDISSNFLAADDMIDYGSPAREANTSTQFYNRCAQEINGDQLLPFGIQEQSSDQNNSSDLLQFFEVEQKTLFFMGCRVFNYKIRAYIPRSTFFLLTLLKK